MDRNLVAEEGVPCDGDRNPEEKTVKEGSSSELNVYLCEFLVADESEKEIQKKGGRKHLLVRQGRTWPMEHSNRVTWYHIDSRGLAGGEASCELSEFLPPPPPSISASSPSSSSISLNTSLMTKSVLWSNSCYPEKKGRGTETQERSRPTVIHSDRRCDSSGKPKIAVPSSEDSDQNITK